ncbi:hypothetical protein Ddye_017796 [Dipteronia dyeriana]|uniref:Sulfotransferase n=1 Tax=Dipteronia dyeriana TaxID=168575 RepID=A0AAD9UA41_9ROSI|nr:hypothetical protein Ddye_017796 [Dipteronia dyeriana]
MEKSVEIQNSDRVNKLSKEDQERVLSLPRVKGRDFYFLCQYQGFWNPLDQFTSYWHFVLQPADPVSIDEAFEKFCQGVMMFGPVWDHELGYWKANLEKSNKILFLKYEDMKEDIIYSTKKLVDFNGCRSLMKKKPKV